MDEPLGQTLFDFARLALMGSQRSLLGHVAPWNLTSFGSVMFRAFEVAGWPVPERFLFC
jgi:hypothetical protein